MAMSKDVLGKAIAAKIISSDAPAERKTQIENQWKEIAGVIIDHIKANAHITVAAGIAVQVTPSSGTGATTATGTATIS